MIPPIRACCGELFQCGYRFAFGKSQICSFSCFFSHDGAAVMLFLLCHLLLSSFRSFFLHVLMMCHRVAVTSSLWKVCGLLQCVGWFLQVLAWPQTPLACTERSCQLPVFLLGQHWCCKSKLLLDMSSNRCWFFCFRNAFTGCHAFSHFIVN